MYGKIRHIITGLPGSTHDKTAVEFSPVVMNYLNTIPPYYAILADSAYVGLHNKIRTTLKARPGHQLTRAEQQYNATAARIRQKVERVIGASQVKWRIQQAKENRIAALCGPQFASKCTMAAAVLHNRYTNCL